MNDPNIVIAAAFITAGMVVAITVYAFTMSDRDLVICIGLLFVLVMTSMMVAIFSIFIRNRFLHMFYVGIAVVIFGLYLLFDTKLLLDGKTYHLFIDDYVLAAMILYIDIIMIFLYLLRLLSDR